MSFSLFNTLAKVILAKSRAMSARQTGTGCDRCHGDLAGGSVTFDCCGMTVCRPCARHYATPLGGGELLVRCRCGSVRRSRLS